MCFRAFSPAHLFLVHLEDVFPDNLGDEEPLRVLAHLSSERISVEITSHASACCPVCAVLLRQADALGHLLLPRAWSFG